MICSVITDKTNGKWKNDMIFIDFSPTSCEFSTQPGLVGPLPVKREKIKIFIALYVNLPKPSFPYFYTNLFEIWCVAYNCLVYV